MDLIGEKEWIFANIVWQNSPVASGLLAKNCEVLLGWKRTTTYTVLKKFCEKGFFDNKEGTVYAMITKDMYLSYLGNSLVEKYFNGSIVTFLSSYISEKELTQSDINEIRNIINFRK